jgi:hypothetical protein
MFFELDANVQLIVQITALHIINVQLKTGLHIKSSKTYIIVTLGNVAHEFLNSVAVLVLLYTY